MFCLRKIAAGMLVTFLALFVLAADCSVLADNDHGAAIGTSDPAKPAEATGAAGTINYTVERGDCLWSVADRFGVEIRTLADINGLDFEANILAGQQLVVPEGKKTVYTVIAGDTLWNIARQFGVDTEVLAWENGLNEMDTLPVGRLLTIPEAGKATIHRTGSLDNYVPRFQSWPVRGQISSAFGTRYGRPHEGLDIAADSGRAIRAIESGTVVWSGWRGTYGNTVIINHGQGVRSLYAHASRLEVSQGEYVKKGQVIARVGSTGHSTGPHLHLEVLYRGNPVDPQNHLPDDMTF